MELREIHYEPPPPPPPPPEPEPPAQAPQAVSQPVADNVETACAASPEQNAWVNAGDGVECASPDADIFCQGPGATAQLSEGPGVDDQAKVDAAAAELERSAREDDPLDAARKLNQQLQGLPAELRGQFLEKSAGSLEQLTERITKLDKEKTGEAVKELARATEAAGPLAADKITGPIARAIADGKLEQKGSDADGGWGGVFQGANTHHSEREFVDGVAGLGDTPGAGLFRDSLTTSLAAEGRASQGERADRATGFAGAVASGKSDHVPDDGLWSGVRNLAKDAVGLVGEAQQRVEDLREKATDAFLDKTLGLSDKLESLEPGDSMKIAVKGAVSLELAGEASAELEVKRNEDGSYSVSGQASLLGGIGAAKNDIMVGGAGKVEFKFDSLEQAKEGTQALAKVGLMAAGNGALPGAGMLAAPSPDEVAALMNNISAVELDASVMAQADWRFGISGLQGLGAEGKLQGNQIARVEFENGKPSAIVSGVEIKGEAAAEMTNLIQKYGPNAIPDDKANEMKERLGFDPRSVKDLQGVLSAEGSLKIQVRTPIDSEPVPGGNPLEQLQAIRDDPGKLVTGPATASISYEGAFEANNNGLKVEFKADNIDPSKLDAVIDRAAQGDITGALAATEVNVSGSVNTYEDKGFDHELDVKVASLGGKNYVRDVDDRGYSFNINADGNGIAIAGGTPDREGRIYIRG
jgi:hypothetical protein